MDYRYLAGFFDGEGCVRIDEVKDTRVKSGYIHQLYITITNTNPVILTALYREFGGTLHTVKRRGNHRQCYQWSLKSKKAKLFLESILPFLVMKKEEVAFALYFQNNLKKLTIDGRIDIRKKLSTMKHVEHLTN